MREPRGTGSTRRRKARATTRGAAAPADASRRPPGGPAAYDDALHATALALLHQREQVVARGCG